MYLGPGATVRVQMHYDNSSSFFNMGHHDMPARISIAYHDDWTEIIDGCMHELLEFGMLLQGLGYSSDTLVVPEFLNRKFIMTHSEFDELCTRTAQVMIKLVPLLGDAHAAELKRRAKKKGNK